jgi:sulfur relay protein TusB/DsrH
MKTYIVLDLPIENYPLIQILATEHENDNKDTKVAFLFMQNAVLLFRNWRFEDTYNIMLENNIDIYVSKSDVIARGIDVSDKKVNQLTYEEIVTLIMDKSEKVFNL